MPTQSTPLTDENILFVRCFGQIEPRDIIGWQVDDRISPNSDNTLVILVDLSGVTGTDMTFDHVNATHGKLARHYQNRGSVLHLVLYAPEDLAFGMTRIMQSLTAMTDHVKVDVFRDPNELSNYLPDAKPGFAGIRQQAIQQLSASAT